MECPCRWTVVAVTIYLSLQSSRVLCENEVPAGQVQVSSSLPEGQSSSIMARDNRDCVNYSEKPIPTDLLNCLLNGAIPDVLPTLEENTVDTSNYQRFPFNQETLVKPLSVIPMPTGCTNAQEFSAYFPTFMVTPFACGLGPPSNSISAIPQIATPGLAPTNFMPPITQTPQFDNYPTCAQNALRPKPIVLKPQCQFGEVNPYNAYNQIMEPISLPEVKTQPLNLPISLPPQVLPAINTCSGNFETNPNVVSSCLPQSAILTSEYQQYPLNVQINVPTPTMPPPKVTVVTATPQNSPVPLPVPAQYCPEQPIYPPFQYPPQPSIILGGSKKSSLRNLLPILLAALLSDREENKGCCCCCNCGNGGNIIPIPYPIPIPVNNPIINNCPYPYCSCNRECRDYGVDDADDYHKRR